MMSVGIGPPRAFAGCLGSAFDTLDIARQLSPTWPSHSLESVATRLKVGNGAEHRALSDARLVKDVFLATLKGIHTVRKFSKLMRVL
jgi:DNA polymerase III epsilon subunit-like protein